MFDCTVTSGNQTGSWSFSSLRADGQTVFDYSGLYPNMVVQTEVCEGDSLSPLRRPNRPESAGSASRIPDVRSKLSASVGKAPVNKIMNPDGISGSIRLE